MAIYSIFEAIRLWYHTRLYIYNWHWDCEALSMCCLYHTKYGNTMKEAGSTTLQELGMRLVISLLRACCVLYKNTQSCPYPSWPKLGVTYLSISVEVLLPSALGNFQCCTNVWEKSHALWSNNGCIAHLFLRVNVWGICQQGTGEYCWVWERTN